MAELRRRLILGNGEAYITAVQKKFNGRSPEPPRSYEEARMRLRTGASDALRRVRSLPASKRLGDEAVFCLRMHPDVTAKTYDPDSIFSEVRALKKIGSRSYRERIGNVKSTKRLEKLEEKAVEETDGRLIFVQATPDGIKQFLNELERTEASHTKRFRDTIRRVERFDTLTAEEQIAGFADSWKEGRAELVFHPTEVDSEDQLEFFSTLFEQAGVAFEPEKTRFYPYGPTFVSCRINRKALNFLAETNPLRAAHPMEFVGLSDLRNAPTDKGPKPPVSSTRSTIKVGVFDGGVDPTCKLLQGFVEEDSNLAIKTPALSAYIEHGTAVAGAVLYGPLNDHGPNAHLPPPPVSVVSIRALPTKDPNDRDLYEAIDVIERAVPARPDIKVFNVSFGPRGPILDDRISRFTYVLDKLSVSHKVTFFVSVGNDGHTAGFERIQAPSDLVHGLGMGAYTFEGDEKIVAPYSCRGPGRECGKIKPDLTAFGGCSKRPIHLASVKSGQKVLSWGTSFSSPIGARLGALATEGFDRSSSLLGRALLIHSAKHPNGKPDNHLGHGCLPDELEPIVSCEDGAVTVVYQRAMSPKQIVQLPIPLPSTLQIPGKVRVTWTVAGLPSVEPNHPADYTTGCLEDTFYPHSQMYSYNPPKVSKGKKKFQLHTVDNAADIKKLLAAGYTRALFPLSESGNSYREEVERRAIDCKWEPLVRRTKSKKTDGLFNPFLTLHAIGRHGIAEPFDYVVIVTIQAKDFEGDLYTEVRKHYPALNPIRLRTEAEVRIQI